MATGTVKWYNTEKGYGFILPDDGSPDVFVHATAVEEANMEILQLDQKLSFELGTNSKNGRSKAINLRLL